MKQVCSIQLYSDTTLSNIDDYDEYTKHTENLSLTHDDSKFFGKLNDFKREAKKETAPFGKQSACFQSINYSFTSLDLRGQKFLNEIRLSS